MLRFLRVRNFALIDQLDIRFEPGFSLLSGETGAGKSIIVDALGLLAGGKAASDMVRTGESKAVVEAVFEIDLAAQLEQLGLDADESDAGQVVIRRELSADGRNRVYINSQPTTVSALRDLGPALLDIHGQHEQQTLVDAASQLTLIDLYADCSAAAIKVRDLFIETRRIESELTELLEGHARKVERLDFLTFQRDEIQKVHPAPGETEQARQRLQVLSHAEKLLETAVRGYQSLYESESSTLAVLAQVQRSLRDAAQHDATLLPLVEQVEAARIGIQDIAYALRDYASQVEADPQELGRLQIGRAHV